MSFERDYLNKELIGSSANELVKRSIDDTIDAINDELNNILFYYKKYTSGNGTPYNSSDSRLVESCLEQKEELLKVLTDIQLIKDSLTASSK